MNHRPVSAEMRMSAAAFRLARPALLLSVMAVAASADETIVNSPHDLSSRGPGPIRAVDEGQICIFCHAPHNASPAAPLWNRHNPTAYYRIYDSSTTDARIDQPGGASKMCLSCHDGSIALGLVLSRDPANPIPMTQTFIPGGPSNLTNDLSDDHPIGFRYDRQLSNRDRQIRSPDEISREIHLGPRGQLECVACHDAHNNELGDFLRITQRQGALCVTCHDMTGWRTCSHALSPRSVPLTVTHGEPLPYASLHDNACLSCHQTHSAPHAERLLRDDPSELCITCHDGLTGTNILSVSNLRSGHRTDKLRNVHDPAEKPFTMPPHVECVDCHNPHAVQPNPFAGSSTAARTQGPFVPPAMRDVPGVSLAGVPIDPARLEYEVCFRCHADTPVPVPNRIVRHQDSGGNIRIQILPTAASAHPIATPARTPEETPSLLPQYRTAGFLTCEDCHNNADARELGGSGPNGPHASPYPYLLLDRYDTTDYSVESAQAYALCYRCHDRNSILNDESFSLHSQHIVAGRSPCTACHAPHGARGSPANHDHLINFALSIVGGQRLYVDTGRFAGTCTLTCHGVQHVNFTYGGSLTSRR